MEISISLGKNAWEKVWRKVCGKVQRKVWGKFQGKVKCYVVLSMLMEKHMVEDNIRTRV